MPKKLAAFALFMLLAALILNATISSVLTNRAEAATTLPPVPAGLKSTFTFGLGNQPGNVNWMTGSGAKWDARYQYLGGGVNTGTGWSTWNSPAGMFASYYMDESSANGYMPIFTYYQMLQSSPANGANEGDKNFNNLNNASTMNAYYADFKLLMDRAKVFGKPVMVHIEPDLWGFLQIRASDPTTLSASVASSGYPEAAAYPNTVAGYAKTLVALRNKYAPNVVLAYHVSPWASSFGDLGTNHDPNFNVTGAAQETANFYLKLGANFDLIFYDIADRDAALYQSWGDPNRWWDATNATYPNFNRFHQFVSSITTTTGKRGMLWQVPLGNTLYRSLNNTTNHWQDNRVQYYLNSSIQHLQDAANAGLMGILFGAGDGQTTSYDDAHGDGVTNPAPINGNNLTSAYADDDGGYLRLQAITYYNQGALALPGGGTVPPTATTAPATPTAPAATPTVTVAPGSGNGLAAAYFANNTLSGSAALNRVDPTVNFSWGTGSPGAGVPADNFSARWTGQVKAVSSETYTFCTRSDDGVRLWINNVQLVNNWTNHGPTDNCGNVVLSQGQLYAVKMEYYEATGGATSTLSWQTPTLAKQIVPQGQLYSGAGSQATPTPTSAPPTATPTNTVAATATPTKTAGPTATPTNTVAATATPTKTTAPTVPAATPTKTSATPAPPASWQMTGAVMGTLTAGSTLTIKGNFTAPGGTNASYLLDVEVYDLATNTKVAQWLPVQPFTAGQLRIVSNTWQVVAGNYVVKLGVFNPDWSFVAWNDSATTFTVR